MTTVLLAGGGSGGHLFPGLAVAEELRRRQPDCRVVFAGSGREIEGTILAGTGFPHHALPMLPPGAVFRQPLRFISGVWRSRRRALRLIDEFHPDAVIGLGGFASLPVGWAAGRRGVRLVLLEQNLVPGRATCWLSKSAEQVAVSFSETAALLPPGTRTVLPGNPVRQVIHEAAAQRDRLQERSTAPTLLVLGGSQGAAGVNQLAIAAAKSLRSQLRNWRIIHQTGPRDVAAVQAGYAAAGVFAEVAAFFPNLPQHYAVATLVVSRAGATTLAELACLGLPAVLVPYPRSARDHQQRNADHYATAGAAMCVTEGCDAEAQMTQTLGRLMQSAGVRAEMAAAMRGLARPDAAAAVCDLVLRCDCERTACETTGAMTGPARRC